MMYHLYTILLILAVFLPLLTFAEIDTKLLPSPDECGQLKLQNFYNQANITQIDEFPWMARILYRNLSPSSRTLLCQAVLISKQYLVTRAFCVASFFEFDAYAVVLGDWYNGNNINEIDCDVQGRCANVPVQMEIEQLIIYPYFNAINENRTTVEKDFALIRLQESVVFSDYIRPICLPSADVSRMRFTAQHLHLTGVKHFGIVRTKMFALVLSAQQCRKQPYIFQNMTDSELCANVCDNVLSKPYFSGSALMGVTVKDDEVKQYYLVGIKSTGYTHCRDLRPSNFARIGYYLDWMADNIF